MFVVYSPQLAISECDEDPFTSDEGNLMFKQLCAEWFVYNTYNWAAEDLNKNLWVYRLKFIYTFLHLL